MKEHRLRFMVHQKTELTDEQLNELGKIFPIEEYLNSYEYSSNFILTKSVKVFKQKVNSMCCGIFTDTTILSNGTKIYFGFDYGH